MRLEGKVAVVTGAASGMGKAIAELYAKEGAKVVVSDLNMEGAAAVVESIKSNGGEAIAVKTNVADLNDINSMIDTAVNEYGTLDILVNNAGIMDNMAPVGDVDDDKWDLIFDVNTKSVMRAIRKSIPIFLEKGEGRYYKHSLYGRFQRRPCGSSLYSF